jgi:signal transduction histidine kinase
MDCIDLELKDGRLLMTRPCYGGSAHAQYTCKRDPQVATLRAKAFEPLEPDASRSGEVTPLNLESSDNMLEVIVIDHGKGFDLVRISSGFSHDKFGLMNIRERIEAMEGQFLMESWPGKGTRIVVRVPLQKEIVSKSDIDETSASPVAGTP